MERALEQLQNQQEKDEQELEEAIKTYVTMPRRQLCQKLFLRLPREIRDEVYHHMLPRNLMLDVRGAARESGYKKHQPATCIFNTQSLGVDAFRELAEHCYRTTRFRFPCDYIVKTKLDSGPSTLGTWLNEKDRSGWLRWKTVKNVDILVNLASSEGYNCLLNDVTISIQTVLRRVRHVLALKGRRKGRRNIRLLLDEYPSIDEISDSSEVFDSWVIKHDLALCPPQWPQDWHAGFFRILELVNPFVSDFKTAGHDFSVVIPAFPHGECLYEFAPDIVPFHEQDFAAKRTRIMNLERMTAEERGEHCMEYGMRLPIPNIGRQINPYALIASVTPE
jgi:hypothetical protein